MRRENGQRKKIDVREKFGDYLMDISKYVITAVLTLLLGIVYYKKK